MITAQELELHAKWLRGESDGVRLVKVGAYLAVLRGDVLTGAVLRGTDLSDADLLQRGQSALHRLHRLQQENARFREPERTILCDILANGTLLPDPDGKRYGVLPADGEVGS
jgi:uncharacterized protein YjbI with pentapeptide repeats